MRFCRRCNSPKHPLTAELVDRFNDAGKRKQLFVDWLNSDENMDEVMVKHKRTVELRKLLSTKFCFMNRKELLTKYHENESLVDEVINSKKAAGHWRRDPDCPNREECHQFLVCNDTTITDESLTGLAFEMFGEGKVKGHRIKRPVVA
eukprot:15464052-Alexandrium_andersonii.AAC.2